MSNADVRHYVQHYGGRLPVGVTDLDLFEKEMLAVGKRYWLMVEDLEDGFRPETVVELGCGGAEALLLLSQRYPATQWRGYDVATKGGVTNGVVVEAANLNERWPCADCSVDGLIAMMIIEHLFDPIFSFREIKRVLSKNGRAWVNLPLVTAISNRLRILKGELPSTSIPYGAWLQTGGWDGAHLHYFSVRSIHDLAAHCGLRVGALRGVGRLHRLKSLAPRLLASEVTFSLEHV